MSLGQDFMELFSSFFLFVRVSHKSWSTKWPYVYSYRNRMTSRMDPHQSPKGVNSANDAAEMVDWRSANLDSRFYSSEVHKILDDRQIFLPKIVVRSERNLLVEWNKYCSV